jgi:mannitol/fructose-specific phosphotransferase system IIA component (Ntr-type)
MLVKRNLAVPLKNILSLNRVIFTDETDYREVLNRLVEEICKSPAIKNSQEFQDEIMKREDFFPVNIGFGIVISHVRLQSITDFVLSVGVCNKPIKNKMVADDSPIRLIFMLASPHNNHAVHLQTLSELCIRLQDDDFRNRLFSASSPKEFLCSLTG